MQERRLIPSIESLRQRPVAQALEMRFGRRLVVDALRREAEAVRLRTHARGPGTALAATDPEHVAAEIEGRLEARIASLTTASLRPVINATGVILHTNLGRAPLAPAALAAIAGIGGRYSTLELDLAAGGRGSRHVHTESLLTLLTGAETAAVTNNNAAAVLLVLAALASGRDVLVSRGELVEIGGAFRVPDVLAQSGAVLREVGTTNRTRVEDYASAMTERTALILRVHQSNFRVVGFTERPALEPLVSLAHERGLPLVEDQGSGWITGNGVTLGDEPDVASSVSAGADVVTFSGDKLLGGPQAGIIVGRQACIGPITRHPLMRALRADKLAYAALGATLLEYAAGRARETVPVRRMLTLTHDAIEARAVALAGSMARNPRLRTEVIAGMSAIGGGSAPGVELPTALVALAAADLSASELERRLRGGDPPVLARIADERVLLDLRTVDPAEDAAIAARVDALV